MKIYQQVIFALVYGIGCAAISAMVFYGLYFELKLHPAIGIIASALTLGFTLFFGTERFKEGKE